MNKKAIAAFAAGATLLAGFAMATPAFANVARTVSTDKAESDSPALQALKDVLKGAYDAADTAEGTLTTKKADVPADVAAVKEDKTVDLLDRVNYEMKDGKVSKVEGKAGDEAKANKVNAYIDALATYNTKLDAVKTAEKNVKDATPAAPKASANVALATLKDAEKPLTEAQTKLDEAFGKYDAAYVAYKQAKQAAADAKKALEDYKRNSDNETPAAYHAEVARLTKALNVALEAETKAQKACDDAKTDFGKAKSAFEKAFSKYAAAYKTALAAKADVSAFATPESLNHDFTSEYQPGEGFVPGAGASHAGKPGAAKPGKPGQAAGQAGANAAAGAKTTVVEKKKDGGKKLPGTGVGVTLTALAATMLAGMGAAVRKARH